MVEEELFETQSHSSAGGIEGISDASEIVIGFVGAVGVNLIHAESAVAKKLGEIGYRVLRVRVTTDVFPWLDPNASQEFDDDYARIWKMMDVGTTSRARYGSAIIAKGIAAKIAEKRDENKDTGKIGYLVHSLKHPEEVRCLREIYHRGFYLIGVHSPPESRRKNLVSLKGIGRPEAKRLMDRDKSENPDFGQQLVDTFHLSDFFVGWEENDDVEMQARSILLLQNSIERFIEIIFGHPNMTPTFGEYAMFLAFTTALRSADLSRQVGAVVARDGEILGVGANDCPSAGGGLYWPILDREALRFIDYPGGRDWTRSADSNRKEQLEIIKQILKIAQDELSDQMDTVMSDLHISPAQIEKIKADFVRKLYRVLLTNSQIMSLTEFGRIVHAEMEALLSCARKGVSTLGATLYSTTFPCHNGAKHIIAAGIKRVVFIEPYLKSRAMKFHNESIEIAYPVISHQQEPSSGHDSSAKVKFEPFFGVGPRKFFDLFSMDIGAGYNLVRKEKGTGDVKRWIPNEAKVRIALKRDSYLSREQAAAKDFTSKLQPGKF